MQRLESKIILVAGNGGIGSELARRYAMEGAAVVLGDLDLDSADAVAEEITRTGGKAVATLLAYIGEQTRVAYAMSKAAGHALMRHVAAKYGAAGVRANCVAPGLIMHHRWDPKMVEAVKDWVGTHGHLKRAGRPGDIASISSLLMSDEGSFITGQIINVDGGSTMRA
jgi:NAD(P)-dependent dehydrogenase (short-subunit alcohol dehydrogenase family)